MKVTEGTFQGFQELTIFYREFSPEKDPKGVVIIVHGLGDHSGGIRNLCEALVENGYRSYVHDLRGHGKSPGTRGFIRDWEEYRNDLHAFCKLVTEINPDLPVYLIGHSIGGVIAVDYAINNASKLGGLITISPAISYETSFMEKLLITVMGKLKSDYTIDQGDDLAYLTKDENELQPLKNDTLRHSTVTPGLGKSLMKTLPRMMEQVKTIRIPFLLQFGLDDTITPPEILRTFFEEVGSDEKEKYEYQSVKHRPFDDTDKETFLQDMVSWLDEQTENIYRLEKGTT
ncbi:alpha/beta hydrolase [Oceanobacillus halotolerans]|uniref:alpha/beta hydrolase n=1 Tax=Oceanobacillus halotolerans TaxID=2663380 RepID=UPI0013DC0705|nr:alpha/beta hydrolase [Oceanobacillus halotolerans]